MPVSGGEAHLLARPVSGRCKSCKQGRLEAEKIEEKRIWFGWILEGNRPRPEPFCPACFAHRRCPASYSWSGNLQTFFLVSWCDVKLCWEKGAFGGNFPGCISANVVEACLEPVAVEVVGIRGILAAIINEKTALPVIEYLLIEHQPFLCDSFRSQLFICITT
ncbi:uncharacterized protein LOC129639166 isoform X3 [Bubalus kerabau]|uniref:uncharacterized protein LOC129639166 isoform X3 n=1 Tax=Bubalus carabanensis TaxID=3119969 RepID=UPI00244E70D0|nr:uncharacterized protein LOC129639166 isoform X3 [Bubalus carabanensis]XP_055420143.1 uncharacterized protein LOC129639166 isoform X3 [Bubalus carabanensis]XP_055420158.1 uncharacterized protein LOC129639166 isoform X3 [Bubalus carabanensis]